MDATQRLLLLRLQKLQEQIENLGGSEGPPGTMGKTGLAATIAIGTVTDVPYGTPPTVTNVGTVNAAIFDFELETGDTGSDANVTKENVEAVLTGDISSHTHIATTRQFTYFI